MGGAGGDAVTIRKDFLGGQGVARLEDTAFDGTTEVGGNPLVRAVVIGWLSPISPVDRRVRDVRERPGVRASGR